MKMHPNSIYKKFYFSCIFRRQNMNYSIVGKFSSMMFVILAWTLRKCLCRCSFLLNFDSQKVQEKDLKAMCTFCTWFLMYSRQLNCLLHNSHVNKVCEGSSHISDFNQSILSSNSSLLCFSKTWSINRLASLKIKLQILQLTFFTSEWRLWTCWDRDFLFENVWMQ